MNRKNATEGRKRRKSLAATVLFHLGIFTLLVAAPALGFKLATSTPIIPEEEKSLVVFDFSRNARLDEGHTAALKQVLEGHKSKLPPPPAEYNTKPQTAPPHQMQNKPDVPRKVVTADNPNAPVMGPKINRKDPDAVNPPKLNAPPAEEPQLDPRSLFHGVPNGKDVKPAPKTDPFGGDGGGDDTKRPGTDNGDNGKGIKDGLKGRKALSRPNMLEKSYKEGTVKVVIGVDRSGNVVSAQFSAKGSTSADPELINRAEKYARQYRYEADYNAAEIQYGFVLFVFKMK